MNHPSAGGSSGKHEGRDELGPNLNSPSPLLALSGPQWRKRECRL